MTKTKASKSVAQGENPILVRLQGRVDYLLKVGRVKDPELMQSALEVLSELTDATQQLLDYLGTPRTRGEANLIDRCRLVIAKVNGGTQ